MVKRKIGLDVGDVRIGVAVSDLMGICANPRETYVRKKDDPAADAEYFAEYAKREDADAFVLGLPKNMDGTEGPRAEITRQFGDLLKETSGTGSRLRRRAAYHGFRGAYAHRRGRAPGQTQKSHRQGGGDHNFAILP